MAGEPLSAPARADATDRALSHAREHLERLGYRLLEQHRDRQTGARLLVARPRSRRERVFCELCAERLGDQERPTGGLRRRRLRPRSDVGRRRPRPDVRRRRPRPDVGRCW